MKAGLSSINAPSASAGFLPATRSAAAYMQSARSRSQIIGTDLSSTSPPIVPKEMPVRLPTQPSTPKTSRYAGG